MGVFGSVSVTRERAGGEQLSRDDPRARARTRTCRHGNHVNMIPKSWRIESLAGQPASVPGAAVELLGRDAKGTR
jgi:hypothetical protein